MRPLDELFGYYPEVIHADYAKDILREYLQFEMLRLLFASRHGAKFTFLGGTALRLAYGTDRFSEDLDFDNHGLTREEFEYTLGKVKRGLELIDYPCELTFTYKGAYHCAVRFTSLLYKYGLSGHKEARLLIKVDTEAQDYAYEREVRQVSGLGVAADIAVVPLDLLCAMKVAAVLGRRRPKGRDYYDLLWCLARTTPDYGYLDAKLGLSDAAAVRARIDAHVADVDFEALARDVAPFLMREGDLARVRGFREGFAAARL